MDSNATAGESTFPDASSDAKAEAVSGDPIMALSPEMAERIAEIQRRIDEFSEMVRPYDGQISLLAEVLLLSSGSQAWAADDVLAG